MPFPDDLNPVEVPAFNYTLDRVVNRVWRMLDQVPLQNEHAVLDSHVLGSPSTSFSKADIIERINSARRKIASMVKASEVPHLVEPYSDDPDMIGANSVRVLTKRVFRNGTFCRRRSVDQHRRLRLSGREATAHYPVYTLEDGRLSIFPEVDSSAGDTYTAWIVAIPEDFDLSNEDDPMDFAPRYEKAIVAHVVAACYQTMQQTPVHEMFMQVFEDEISFFTRNVRFTTLQNADREVQIE